MKKKVLKIVGIIFALLLLMVIIYFGRNFVIINKLIKARDNFFSSNNYTGSCSFSQNDGSDVLLEYKYKDGKSMEIVKYNSANQANATLKIWIDRNTKEKISITEYSDEQKPMATLTDFQDSSFFIDLWKVDLSNKFKSTFLYNIKDEEIDGKKYYKIAPIKGEEVNVFYFDKDTLLLTELLIQSQKHHFSNLITNNVENSDVTKPDLTGYEITDYRK